MKNLALLIIISVILLLLTLAGGIYPWTTWICAIVLCVTYLIISIPLKNKLILTSPATKRYKLIELCFLASLLFLMIMQHPMPLPFTRITGAERFQQNKTAAELLDKGSDILATQTGAKRATHHRAFTMTRNRAGTMRNTILLIAIFVTILVTSTLVDKQRQLLLAFLCLLGGTLAIAGYIALRIIPQGDTIWWIHKIPHNLPGPVLCFINRNHFAGYLAMLCPAALALFFYNAKSKRPLSAILNLATFAVISLTIALTMSRGAVVSYGAGMLILLLVYLTHRRWIPAAIMIFLGLAVIVSITVINNQQFNDRMSTLRAPLEKGNFDERIDEWKTCGTIWKTYPIFGAGPDAYRMVFPQHRTTSRREYATHAENEYLQLIADTGIVGILITLTTLLTLIIYIRRSKSDGSAAYNNALFPAAISAIAVATTHACFDFAPHLPLYGITAAIFIGLLLHAPDPNRPQQTVNSDTLLKRLQQTNLPWIVIFALLILLTLTWNLKSMRQLDSPRHMLRLDKQKLAKAVVWAPSSWNTWFSLGTACSRSDDQETAKFGERCLTRATELDPNNYILWLETGKLRHKLNMTAEAKVAFDRAKELRFWVNIPKQYENSSYLSPRGNSHDTDKN
ncbi:MAG: O-antigen ligase family protein [Kiritimatiellae bacterium]|nr:O-antigen ligase family protein [Kiritimatiellia bacterium]